MEFQDYVLRIISVSWPKHINPQCFKCHICNVNTQTLHKNKLHDISPHNIPSACIQSLITYHWNLKPEHTFGTATIFSILHSADPPRINTSQHFFSHWGGKYSVNVSSCCNPVNVMEVSISMWHETKILTVKGGDTTTTTTTTSSYYSCTSCGYHNKNLTICFCAPKLPLLSFIPCSQTFCMTSFQSCHSHPVLLPSVHILFPFTFKTNSEIQVLLTITMCSYNLIPFITNLSSKWFIFKLTATK